jgi:hypothetical protein
MATFSSYTSESIHNTYYTLSVDGGLTWNTPKLLKAATDPASNPILLSNETILTSAISPSDYKEYIHKSIDGGTTFTEIVAVTDSTNQVNEPAILELKTNGIYQGKVMMMVRTPTSYIKYISTDYGSTWDSGTAVTTSNYVATRPTLSRLSSDIIVFSHGDSAYNLVLEVSTDEGITWMPYIIMNLATKGYGNITSAYPDTMLLNDNKTLAITWCTNLHSPDLSDVYISFVDISVFD